VLGKLNWQPQFMAQLQLSYVSLFNSH